MNSQRVFALDWLRVFAFFLLMFYHTGMIFVGWDFHVQNPELLEIIAPVMIFMNQWRLPLLFAISGAGTWYALRRRSGAEFVGERTLRLFLPLVFGMFFIVPPQIYVERVLSGEHYASYLAFQSTVFDRVSYPEGGAFSWHHLWFVLYLFFISLVALPLMAWLRRTRPNAWLTGVRRFVAGRLWWLMAPAALLTAIHLGLDLKYEETHGFFDDPAALIRYGVYFMLGFFFFGSAEIRDALREKRAYLLLIMATAFVLQRILIAYRVHFEEEILFLLYFPLRAVFAWGMILTLFGYTARYLNFSNGFLRYANEAVYPFYILHQSVMLVVFYFSLNGDMGPWARFLLVLLGMFGITWFLYEAVIRNSQILRPLFGMRLRRRSKRKQEDPVGGMALVPVEQPS